MTNYSGPIFLEWKSTGLKKSAQLSIKQKRSWIKFDASISIRHQCLLIGLCRSGLYHAPQKVTAAHVALMHRIDQIYTFSNQDLI